MIAPASACQAVVRPVELRRVRWHRLVARRRGTLVIAMVLAALSAEAYWAAPYVGDALDALQRAHVGWVAVAVVAELASMLGFARLQRVILQGAGVRVRLRDALHTVFAGNAMTVTLPGGSVASFTYSVRRMRSWGASTPLAVFSLAATGVLSTVALIVLGGAGIMLSGNVGGLVGVALETLVVVVATVAALRMIADPRVTARIARLALRGWARLRRRSVVPDEDAVQVALSELAVLRPTPATWARGLTFAMANWSADVVCLFAAERAVGGAPGVSTLLLAYAAGMAAMSSVPFVPGGLGVVEPTMILVLVHGGMPAAAATAGVLVYRCINLGLVALAGWSVLLVRRAYLPRAARKRRLPSATSTIGSG